MSTDPSQYLTLSPTSGSSCSSLTVILIGNLTFPLILNFLSTCRCYMLLCQSLASPCLPSLEAPQPKHLLFHDIHGSEEDIPDSLVFIGIINVHKKNNIKSETKID